MECYRHPNIAGIVTLSKIVDEHKASCPMEAAILEGKIQSLKAKDRLLRMTLERVRAKETKRTIRDEGRRECYNRTNIGFVFKTA